MVITRPAAAEIFKPVPGGWKEWVRWEREDILPFRVLYEAFKGEPDNLRDITLKITFPPDPSDTLFIVVVREKNGNVWRYGVRSIHIGDPDVTVHRVKIYKPLGAEDVEGWVLFKEIKGDYGVKITPHILYEAFRDEADDVLGLTLHIYTPIFNFYIHIRRRYMEKTGRWKHWIDSISTHPPIEAKDLKGEDEDD